MSPVLLMKTAPRKDFELTLDEIAKEGARRMLIQALDLEVADYIERFKTEVDEDGHKLVVRNGKARERGRVPILVGFQKAKTRLCGDGLIM